MSLVLVSQSVTTLFHELGHAIPMLLLSKHKVNMYIGSHGDPEHAVHFKISRLEVFFKYNFFSWDHGLCVPNDTDISINRQLVYTILGPIASLLLGALLCSFIFYKNVSGILNVAAVILLISCIGDFFANIIPRKNPIVLHDGTVVFNDGEQLRQLFLYKTLPTHYTSAVKYYNNKEFEKSGEIFQLMVDRGIIDEYVYKLLVSCLIQQKKYDEALPIQLSFEEHFDINSDDLVNAGLVKCFGGKREEGMKDFDKSIELNSQSEYALNNRGYMYNLSNEFDKAIKDFDDALKVNPKFYHSLNNRGFARIRLGLINEGLKDLQVSISIESENAFAFRNLGIYHFDIGEYDQALEYFYKTQDIDRETPLLREYLIKIRQKQTTQTDPK